MQYNKVHQASIMVLVLMHTIYTWAACVLCSTLLEATALTFCGIHQLILFMVQHTPFLVRRGEFSLLLVNQAIRSCKSSIALPHLLSNLGFSFTHCQLTLHF